MLVCRQDSIMGEDKRAAEMVAQGLKKMNTPTGMNE
jgi:hypothetical protein